MRQVSPAAPAAGVAISPNYLAFKETVKMARGRTRKSEEPEGGPMYADGAPGDVLSDGEGLLSAKEFKGADGSEDHWRDVHWVYNNLWVKEVKASDAPSAGAWFWLVDCRTNADARAKFRDYYMKLAPSRKELDERARRADGGESVLELLSEIERVLQ